jgi:hypothetical protein
MVEKISSYSQVASLVVTLGEGGRELECPFLLFQVQSCYEELKQICL